MHARFQIDLYLHKGPSIKDVHKILPIFDPPPSLVAVIRIEPTPLPPGVRVRKARFITQSQDFSKSVVIGQFLDVICMI